jgi:protocatechuate 3,4-dioxygenase beta subunit
LLAGVQIDLLDESGDVLVATHTDQEGRYRFEDLTPGRYQVFEHQPEGYFDGPDHVGTAGGRSDGVDTIMDIPLTSGTHAEEYNFCEHVGVNLSGAVYHDANNDGRFDADETGIGGVTLMLLDAVGRDTGLRATTSTAAGNLGRYQFTNLRGGTYGIAEQQPEGYLDGIDTPGDRGGAAENPGDRIVGAVLPFGQNGTDYNFGELLPARISGSVRARTGQDCFVEEETQPIAGVVIELLGRNGQVVATTTTDAGGRYVFTGLRPDTYGIHERQPDGYFQGSQRVGSGGGRVMADDLIGAIPAGSGQQLVGYDFCEVPAAAISGHVFQDGAAILALEGVPDNVHELRDGLLTDDDRPIAGVTLELRHGVSGDPILARAALPGYYPAGPIRTTTGANGFYQFNGLAAGTYAVFEVHPSAYVDSIDTPGSAGGVAINPHEPVSPFVIMQLTVDPADDAILRIPLKAGETSTDNNFSEVLVEPLVPPPAPPVPAPEPVTIVPPFLQTLKRIWLPPQVPSSEPATPFGGSSQVIAYTWHLSVIDGGQPRSNTTDDMLVQMTSSRFDVVAWRNVDMRRSSWKFRQVDIDGDEARRRALFGTPDAIPVTGDFNGDGITEQGVFINGQWFIDLNGNGQWDPGDLWAELGHNGDLPVTGDWDGDGKTDIGIFGLAWPGDPMAVEEEPGLPDPHNVASGPPKNIPPDPPHAAIGTRTMKLTSQGKMRADVIDHVFHYGTAGDRPVTGDWNGDGIDTIGVFRDGQWHIDTNGDGKWTDADSTFTFGQTGDVPVVGDWNGDGVDKVGVYRNGTWHLDANGDHQFDTRDQVFQLGTSTDTPVTGDWNGDGTDEPGIYLRKTG